MSELTHRSTVAAGLVALALTALSLVPSGAHLLEMTHKMALDQRDYFVVQQIYAGWALSGIVIVAAVMANLWLYAIERRSDPRAARFALLSAVLIVVSLAVFFGLVFPANRGTANWTTVPADWAELRSRWETGHAIGAVLTFLATLSTGRALLGDGRR